MDTPGTSAKSSSRTWVYFLIGAVVVAGIVLVIMKQTGSQQSGKAGLSPVSATTCTDSDGGLVTTVQGYVDFRGTAYVDGCVDANRVRETSCLKEKLKRTTLSCDSGYQCVDGACVPTTYTLTIENGAPSILMVVSNEVSGAASRISCGTDCSESYIAGTVVTLGVGSVDSKFAFNGYTGDCTGGSCILTMDSDKTVGLTYVPATTEPATPPSDETPTPSTEPAPPPISVCLDDQYTCEPFPACTPNMPFVTRNCTVTGFACTIPAEAITTMGCTGPAPAGSGEGETPPTPPSGGSTPATETPPYNGPINSDTE